MPLRSFGFLFSLCALLNSPVIAQDIIIRIYGDSIHCKVDNEDQRFVYYRTVKTERGETEIISRKEIREIVYGLETDGIGKLSPRKKKKPYESVQFLVHAGYSRIFAKDDIYDNEDFELVYDEIRGGVFLDFRLNYFLNEEIGVGVLYSNSGYSTTSDVNFQVLLPDSLVLSGPLSHDRRVDYYAINLAYRIRQPSSNVNLQVDMGFGLLRLEDRGQFINDYTLTSTGLGGHISGSFHLGLGQGFYLPAFISLKGFSLSAFDFDTPPEMNPDLARGLEALYENLEAGISMSRLDLGLGLGFAF